jgi:C4-dicarboxylate transporter DctM subunit
LILVNVILLIVGCFMDIMSAILILAPMLAPMAAAVGIDPVHMGIIFIVNLEIGYLTPPVGMNLFVSSTLFRRSLGWVIKAVVPTLSIMFIALVVITWVPSLSLGLIQALKTDATTSAPTSAPTTTPTPAPTEVAPPTPADGEGRVKSLQEIMNEAKAKDGGASEPAPGKVKSLQEIMEEAKAKDAAGAQTPPIDGGTTGEATPGRVKSLQELMQEAKAKAASESATPTP